MVLFRALCLLIGYLFGCVLSATIVVRYFDDRDISEIGTGNPGMANVMANVGRKAGLLVLFGDILKTLLALWISWMIAHETIENASLLYAGLGAILGHNFPFWRRFRGGKGVAVTVTFLILIMPVYGTLASILGGALTLGSRSLAFGAVMIPLLALPFAFVFYGTETGIVVLISLLLMISRHYPGLLAFLKRS